MEELKGKIKKLDYKSFLSDGFKKVFIGKIERDDEEGPDFIQVAVDNITLTFEKKSILDMYIFFSKNENIYPEYLKYLFVGGKAVRLDYVKKGLSTIATLLGRKGIGITQTIPYAPVEDDLTDAVGFLYGSFFMIVVL